ncbi:ubiquitin-conjugating enzyme E2Q-like protein 1 [Nilaparvata lugens]|uniref:ubiquitin-conjugating enzyme E2Q-like protein 1 n=1 Tax=Nilaparvata lugens TaxID=108931 RepID=UPI00193E7C68|nr:ubiquitin-conjugating enzyme E2Q-like protein 1 [Nilaparvata lugens]
MTSKSKEKMAAAFRKLFHTGDKHGGGGGDKTGAVAAPGSPAGAARRLLGRHGWDHVVSPAASDKGGNGPSNGGGSGGGSGGGGFFKKKSSSSSTALPTANAENSLRVRTRRLMKELKDIQRSSDRTDHIFTVELINDNLFEWHIRLYRIDAESDLAADMRELGVACISLHLLFPDNFPFEPPFMRVVSPRIEKGFVMEGGAICMELLTPRGWASAYTVEAIVMQFAASLVKGQGRIARKPKSGSKDFNRRLAEESFRSLVKTHEKYGWVTPPLADG